MSTSIRNKRKQILRLLLALITLSVWPYSAQAQEDQEAKALCFPPGNKTAVVKGFIGGEAHDSYAFHVRAGRKITVRMTSTANRAQFTVSKSEFSEPVSFGQETEGGRKWSGTIPETGVYFISVVAHPTARYTLRVTKE